MKRKIFLFFILIFFALKLFSTENTNYFYYQEKDPFVAGLLSATMMGLGQFYAKEYTKGSLFILTDFIQKGGLIWMFVALNEKYTDETKNDHIVEWNEISNADKAFIIGFIAFYYGTKIFCIIDAVQSAKIYNRDLRKNFSYKSSPFNFVFDKNNFSFYYLRKF